jgi:hypothetical protein
MALSVIVENPICSPEKLQEAARKAPERRRRPPSWSASYGKHTDEAPFRLVRDDHFCVCGRPGRVGGLERLDWSVPDGTDGVIVELGANDMLRGIDPAVTRRAIERIVEKLKQRDIPVMLAGMLASPNLGPAYAEKFNSLYRDIADKHDVVLYPFFLDGVVGDRRLNLPDGMHPTAKGVEVIVERILPTVETFLGRLTQR